jgi:hypothetical protein
MGPLAWLGWLSPILVGASVGATAMMLITGLRLLRLRGAAARSRPVIDEAPAARKGF